MSVILGIWIPCAILLLAFAFFIIRCLSRLPNPAIEDVHLFLRRVDLPLVESLSDPAEEARLRDQLSPLAFRNLQRTRIMASLEQYARLSHNTLFLLNCMRKRQKESDRLNPSHRSDQDELECCVLLTATDLRRCLLWKTAKLRIWKLLRIDLWLMFPIPSLSDLRHARGKDILQTYEDLVSSAGQITLSLYGVDAYDKIMAALSQDFR